MQNTSIIILTTHSSSSCPCCSNPGYAQHCQHCTFVFCGLFGTDSRVQICAMVKPWVTMVRYPRCNCLLVPRPPRFSRAPGPASSLCWKRFAGCRLPVCPTPRLLATSVTLLGYRIIIVYTESDLFPFIKSSRTPGQSKIYYKQPGQRDILFTLITTLSLYLTISCCAKKTRRTPLSFRCRQRTEMQDIFDWIAQCGTVAETQRATTCQDLSL